MGEEEKEKEIKDFEDLLKDLNSLFDKIPDMVGSSEGQNSNKGEQSKEVEINSQTQQENSKNVEEFIIEPDAVEDEKLNDIKNETERKDDNAETTFNTDLVEEEKNETKSKDDLNKEDYNIKLDVSTQAIADNKEISNEGDSFKLELEEDSEIKLEFDEKLNNLEVNQEEEKKFDTLHSEDEKEFVLDINDNISMEQQIKNVSDFYSRQNILSEDLKEVIYTQRPSDVSSDRVKKIGIVCAVNGEQLLKSFLRYLDEICFSSKDKKMFVERSFVLFYDENFSVENLMVNANNEKVNAVVFVGNLPVERVYEMENAVCGAGYMFFSIGMDNFSKSKVIDFVLELIAGNI